MISLLLYAEALVNTAEFLMTALLTALFASVALAQVTLLGLARDFVFDITAGNRDRLVFSSQGSGIQAFTFYSEGDLSDSLAFYLYGLWTYDGVAVPPADLRLTLLKTRAGLPVERYNVTGLIDRSQYSPQNANIMTALTRHCKTMVDLIRHLQSDQLGPNEGDFPELMPQRLCPFLPRFPLFLEELLARTMLPFRTDLEAGLPQVNFLHGVGRQTTKPADFNLTWQKVVDGVTETLAIVYERGSFKMIAQVGTETLLDILLSN